MTDDFLTQMGLLALGIRLRRLGSRLQDATQSYLDSQGSRVSVGHFPLLALLAQETSLTLGEAARRLGLAQPGVSRIAAMLDREGLIVRNSDRSDRRVQNLRLTGKGRALIAHAEMEWWPVITVALERVVAPNTSLLAQLAALERALSEGRYPPAGDKPTEQAP